MTLTVNLNQITSCVMGAALFIGFINCAGSHFMASKVSFEAKVCNYLETLCLLALAWTLRVAFV